MTQQTIEQDSRAEASKIFSEIDEGLSYKDAANKYGLSAEVLMFEHIQYCREQPEYRKQIQKYTISLIQDVSVVMIRAMNLDSSKAVISKANASEKFLIRDFFSSRADELIPFKYRDAAKALACLYVKQLDGLDNN